MIETNNKEENFFNQNNDEPLVYNRISDALEDDYKNKMKAVQNNIILKHTQQDHSSVNNKKGTYVSKRNIFRFYRSLSFINNSYTVGGFISCCLALISFILLFCCFAISIRFRGNIGTKVGFFALFSFVFSIFGFLIGLKSFKEEEKSYLFTRIGSYFSLSLTVFWVIMYIRGVLIR